MFFRSAILALAALLIAAPIAPKSLRDNVSKRDMHIESTTTLARNGFQGGL